MAFLSYQLATIKVDVPLDIGLDDLQMGPKTRPSSTSSTACWNSRAG
jgi:5'-3' exonuclease